MNVDPDPREERLPKYARDKLAYLRMRLREVETARAAARLATDPDGSSAVLDRYADIPIGLGADARVTFKTGGHLTVTVHRDDWGALYVYGSEPFAVHPQSSNVVTIVPRSADA